MAFSRAAAVGKEQMPISVMRAYAILFSEVFEKGVGKTFLKKFSPQYLPAPYAPARRRITISPGSLVCTS